MIINSRKCEIFWPSGDQLFSEFDSEVIRIGQVSGGIEILGSPVYGSDSFFIDSVGRRVDKVLNCQDHLMDLEDPQVEIHLLRSCLGVCKLNHILRTVPTYRIDQELVRFDSGVRHSLEVLSHSSISDNAWKQAALPIRLGGLGLRESIRTAPAAFIGSCNTTRDLSHQLLLNSSLTISLWELFAESDGRPDTPCDLIIPGELCTVIRFCLHYCRIPRLYNLLKQTRKTFKHCLMLPIGKRSEKIAEISETKLV